MGSRQDQGGAPIEPEEPSPDVNGVALAEVREAVAALKVRIAGLEETGRTDRATMRRLGLDVVALGRILHDRIGATERAFGGETAGTPKPDGDRAASAVYQPKRTPPSAALVPALIVSGTILLAIALLWALTQLLGDRRDHARPARNAQAVVLGDAPKGHARTPAGQAPDPGHVLYPAPAATSDMSGKP